MNCGYSKRCNTSGCLYYFSAGYYSNCFPDVNLSASDLLTTTYHVEMSASFQQRMTAPDVVYPNIRPFVHIHASGCSSPNLLQSRSGFRLISEVCHTEHMMVQLLHTPQHLSLIHI